MMRIRTIGTIVALHAIAAIAGQADAQEPTATVIEFHNASLAQYFVTASPSEAAMLDAGRIQGWTRTGVKFNAWAAGDRAGTHPVCRFGGNPGSAPRAPFYTVDTAECEAMKSNPNWTYEGIAFHIEVPAAGACPASTQPVWRVSNQRLLPDATMVERGGSAAQREGVVMCAALSSQDIDADAVRLASQATFGATQATIDAIKSMGAAAWVDAQLAQPSTRYTVFAPVPSTRPATCIDDRTQPITATSFCARDNYSNFQVQREFWIHAIQASDQLRQRIAFALSQFFVISGNDVRWAYAMGRYQQMLVDGAFGNFEKLITDVTLSPAMGRYLDMANNRKSNPATRSEPNENYARELLQLFSIGTIELKRDGTPLLDVQGRTLATYGNDEVEGFAHLFTGWTYPTAPGAPYRNANPSYFDGPMEERSIYHDVDAKELLDAVAPAGQTMSADLAFAMRNVFMHPNVPPFVAKALIQKLVTGDPTPAYVARVAQVFENDGSGVRGNLAAVVRAILLDVEARGPAKFDPAYGKLREPILLMAGVARALGAKTDGVYFRATTSPMGQLVYSAPSVFNFYPPDYVVPGTTLIGPEFGIQNTASSLARINALDSLLAGSGAAVDANVYGATGTTLDWTPWTALAGDANALVDKLDAFFMHRTLSPQARAAIVAAVASVPATDRLGRSRVGMSLIVTSSQYQVER